MKKKDNDSKWKNIDIKKLISKNKKTTHYQLGLKSKIKKNKFFYKRVKKIKL